MQPIDDIFYRNLVVPSRVSSIELDVAALIIDILQVYFESGSAFSSFDAYETFPHHCVPIIVMDVWNSY